MAFLVRRARSDPLDPRESSDFQDDRVVQGLTGVRVKEEILSVYLVRRGRRGLRDERGSSAVLKEPCFQSLLDPAAKYLLTLILHKREPAAHRLDGTEICLHHHHHPPATRWEPQSRLLKVTRDSEERKEKLGCQGCQGDQVQRELKENLSSDHLVIQDHEDTLGHQVSGEPVLLDLLDYQDLPDLLDNMDLA